MGASTIVATTPAQLVRAPTGSSLYQTITVTNGAASLVSLLTSGVLPNIPVANINGPAGQRYAFKFVDLQAGTDPSVVAVRYTADGQTAPTASLGFIVPGGASFVRIPCDPQDIQLISTGANVTVNVYLGIGGTTTGLN